VRGIVDYIRTLQDDPEYQAILHNIRLLREKFDPDSLKKKPVKSRWKPRPLWTPNSSPSEPTAGAE